MGARAEWGASGALLALSKGASPVCLCVSQSLSVGNPSRGGVYNAGHLAVVKGAAESSQLRWKCPGLRKGTQGVHDSVCGNPLIAPLRSTCFS